MQRILESIQFSQTIVSRSEVLPVWKYSMNKAVKPQKSQCPIQSERRVKHQLPTPEITA